MKQLGKLSVCNRFALGSMLLVAANLGCAAQARKDVRKIVDQHGAFLRGGYDRSLISFPALDAFFRRESGKILDAARSLDAEAAKDQPGSLNLYDRYNVYLVHSIVPNAWTYGDDFAEVTTAQFLQADTVEELTAALAHEFGHIRSQHAVKRETGRREARGRFIALSALAGAVGGYTGNYQLQQTVLNNSQVYLNAYEKYNPKNEIEADLSGLQIFSSIGYDPKFFDDFLEKNINYYGDRGSATHPPSTARIGSIRKSPHWQAPAPPPNSTGTAELRTLQRLVVQELNRRVQAKTLAFHEPEMRRLRDAGYAVYASYGCGPVDAAPEVLAKQFMAYANRRLH